MDDLVKRLRFGSLTTMGSHRMNLEAADRIQALEARIAKADALAEAVGNATRMKVSPVTAGGRLRLEVDLQRLDAALAAYREGSDT